jgi:hypothetical protein
MIDFAPAAYPKLRTPALIDRFIELFRMGDAAALAALLQSHASIELVGSSYNDEDGDHDWFEGLVARHLDWPPIWQFEAQRLASAVVCGEAVLLVFRTRRGREKLEQVVRIDEENGRIARLRDYGFCPDTTAALGRMLDLPVRRGPYRYPSGACIAMALELASLVHRRDIWSTHAKKQQSLAPRPTARPGRTACLMAHCHEVSSCGYWPGAPGEADIFYSCAYPEPAGFRDAPFNA